MEQDKQSHQHYLDVSNASYSQYDTIRHLYTSVFLPVPTLKYKDENYLQNFPPLANNMFWDLHPSDHHNEYFHGLDQVHGLSFP